MKYGFVLLPIPLSASTLKNGSVEDIILGTKRYKVKIPPGVSVGQRIRLRGIAEHIDSRLHGQDVHLLVQAHGSGIYQVRRDVHIELPLDHSRIDSGGTERIIVGEKKFDVRIPARLRLKDKLRLAGAAEHCNGGYAGDIYLNVVPKERLRWRWWGLFTDFGQSSEQKISIKFKLPWFLEVEREWIYKTSSANLHVGKS